VAFWILSFLITGLKKNRFEKVILNGEIIDIFISISD